VTGERTHPLLWAATGIVLAYLALPSLVVVIMSLSGGRFLEFPPSTVSMRWYQVYWSSTSWMHATARSLEIAVAVTVLATSLGTLASIALVRLILPGKSVLRALVVSPIMVPTTVARKGR